MAGKRFPLEIRRESLVYRWGCIKRDSRFRKDHEDYKEGHLGEIDLCNKWGLYFVPDDLNEVNPLGEADVPIQLIEILTGGDTATLSVTPDSQPLLKAQWDQSSGHYQTRRNQRAQHRQSSFKIPKGERRWVVVLNPHATLRLILQGIKWLPWSKKANAERAKKNIDLCFEVYDRYQKGEDYSSIAVTLHRAPSVVIRAYYQVYQDIHGELPPRKKKLRRLKEFNPETHFQICQTCRKAKSSVKEFCSAGRDFVSQDESYQREIPRDPSPPKKQPVY